VPSDRPRNQVAYSSACELVRLRSSSVPTVEQLSGDPHPYLAELRAESPVAWVSSLGTWLVTGRDEALEVMRDSARFTVDDPRFTTARVVGPSMLSLDGAEHDRHRSAFSATFRPAVTRERMGQRVDEIATRLVGEAVRSGTGDVRRSVAAPLAAQVIIEVLGLVDTTVEEVTDWYGAIVTEVSALTRDPARVADPTLMEGLRAAIAASVVDQSSVLGECRHQAGLTDAEFASNVAVVMFGALETSEAMIANLLWHVLGDAEVEQQLRATPDLRDRAIEESLRLEPGAAVVDRYAVRSTEVAGIEIGRRDPVTVSLAAANRDPAAHLEPNRFSLDRGAEPSHLAFATGPHACLGAYLARMEARAALDAVFASTARPTLDPRASEPPSGLVFRKPEKVVVEWGTGER
jgi:cytochrome P450